MLNHPDIGTIWRHIGTGHVYTIVGMCRLEATDRPAYLYERSHNGIQITWARDMAEFLDGRFERLDIEPLLEKLENG